MLENLETKHKRTFWIQTDKDTGQYLCVIDCDEIVAVNVPDKDKPGCDVTLRNGQVISFPNWDKELRDRNIAFILGRNSSNY